MVIRMIEGFDTGGSLGVPAGWAHLGGTVQFTTGRLGGSSMWRSGSVNGFSYSFASLGGAIAEGACGFAQNISGGGLSAGVAFFQLREGATNHMQLWQNSDGKIVLASGSGAVLDTHPDSLVMSNLWHYFEVEWKISDTVGYFRVYINGETTPLLEFNGDTRNAGTVGTIDTLYWQSTAGGGTAKMLDDCWLVDNTGPAPYNMHLGDCKVEVLLPNGNGDSSGMVGSDANSVDNYLLVDDLGTTADYVGGAALATRDLYQVANPTGDIGTVLATQVMMMAAKNDAGSPLGGLLAAQKSVGGTVVTEALASIAQLSTTYSWFTGVFRTADPNGDPWTLARLNGLQVGPEVG